MKPYKIEIDSNWNDAYVYASVYAGKYKIEIRHKVDGDWLFAFPTRRAARKAARCFIKQIKEAETEA